MGKVAHFKCPVLLFPSGTTCVTGLDLPPYITTKKELDELTATALNKLTDAAVKKAKKEGIKEEGGKED